MNYFLIAKIKIYKKFNSMDRQKIVCEINLTLVAKKLLII